MNVRISASLPLILSGLLHAAQVCDLTFTACPKQLPAGTLTVPMDVISLDARIPACRETSTKRAIPSIVFIIDNSGSMADVDGDEQRFSVMTSLLDSINATEPAAEVGLVIFTRRLQFDHRDNPLFVPAFPGDTSQHDSYVPLTALNKVFPDGRTGVDTLKALLKHNSSGGLIYATQRPGSRTPHNNIAPINGDRTINIRDGTDITLGFQAAKEAIKAAKAPKENQYFIFLSDGLPVSVDSSRIAIIGDFQKGINVPTTFTVFFQDSPTPTVPDVIRIMTDSIKANGYSASNPSSNYWASNLSGNTLLTRLTTVLSSIVVVPTVDKGVEVAVNGIGETTTNRIDSTHFLLSGRKPLSADLTPILFNYMHTFRDTTVTPPVTRDTVVRYSANVQRSANAILPPFVTKTCREQADLALLSGGQILTSVTANHGTLEVRVTPPEGQTCVNCTVQASPSASADRETIPLIPLGASVSGTFTRVESLTPAAGDGKFQHVGTDSLVFVWVNPLNPLDMVRKSYPYLPIPATLALFHEGRQIDTVTGAHSRLQIRLTLPAGEVCNACPVEVFLSGSPDRENIALAGAAAPYLGDFPREVALGPVAGDGKLSHLVSDSIILIYRNPLTNQVVRRAYVYVDFKNDILLIPHNDVAKITQGPLFPVGPQWVISDAPNIIVQPYGNGGACCGILPATLNAQNPDSARFVGVKVEASREFMLEMIVYSNLGEIVNKVAFVVPRSEFLKLSPVTGKETRVMRLLWNGVASTGTRAGTGAYIFRTTVSLLPVPGVIGPASSSIYYRTVGVLRNN